MPVLTTYEWTDNMPYVYLDVLKQTAPITGDSTDKYNTNGKRDFVILGYVTIFTMAERMIQSPK